MVVMIFAAKRPNFTWFNRLFRIVSSPGTLKLREGTLTALVTSVTAADTSCCKVSGPLGAAGQIRNVGNLTRGSNIFRGI